MNIVFGDAEGLHKHLLKFTAKSSYPVTHDGNTYYIEHTQFASYDITDAYQTVLEHTDSDPREGDLFTFSDELEEAITHSRACFTDRDLHSHYNKREYIEPRDIGRAAQDYSRAYSQLEENNTPRSCIRPQPTSREEAIADIFSLMHADRAGMSAYLPFSTGPPYTGDNDSEEKPDEGYNHTEIGFTLRDTTEQLHGPSALRQPNPSLHTTRTLFEIFDEIGMRPTVRTFYGLIVSPTPTDYYKHDDAAQRKMGRALNNIANAAMGMGEDHTRKWLSNSEPPLETLDSYEATTQE